MKVSQLTDDLFVAYHDNGVKLGDIVMAEDGFYVFFPELRGGFWESHVLRNIADKLDEMNAPYEKQIEEFFTKQKEDKSPAKVQPIAAEIQEAEAPVDLSSLMGLGGKMAEEMFEDDPDINWVEGDGTVPRIISLTRPFKQSEVTKAAIEAYKKVNPEQPTDKPSTPMSELSKPK